MNLSVFISTVWKIVDAKLIQDQVENIISNIKLKIKDYEKIAEKSLALIDQMVPVLFTELLNRFTVGILWLSR